MFCSHPRVSILSVRMLNAFNLECSSSTKAAASTKKIVEFVPSTVALPYFADDVDLDGVFFSPFKFRL